MLMQAAELSVNIIEVYYYSSLLMVYVYTHLWTFDCQFPCSICCWKLKHDLGFYAANLH